MRKEAGWALANALTGAGEERIVWLGMCGAVPALCSLIDKNIDRRLTERSLNALDAILKIDSAFVATARQCGALDVIQRLMMQSVDVVLKEKVIGLVEDFLPPATASKIDVLYSFVRS